MTNQTDPLPVQTSDNFFIPRLVLTALKILITNERKNSHSVRAGLLG
jgi:hypothetical protein